jgi:hypothetical protein
VASTAARNPRIRDARDRSRARSPGGVEPSRRIRRRRRRRKRALGRKRHGGAPRGGVPVARDGPRLASVASRLTSATSQGNSPPGAPPTPLFGGKPPRRGRKEPERQRRLGNQETALFDIVKRKDASGAAPKARSSAIASAATRSAPVRGRASTRHWGNEPACVRCGRADGRAPLTRRPARDGASAAARAGRAWARTGRVPPAPAASPTTAA